MAVLFIDGFDKYGPANSTLTVGANLLATGDWTTSTGTTHAIVAGLSSPGTAVQFGASASLTRTLGANYTRLIGGLRFQSNLVNQTILMQFRDAGTAQCSITLETTGSIVLRNGGSAGTTLASGGAIVANSTHYIEWDITFGNSASYQVWLDSLSLFSGTGDTTGTANNFANQILMQSAASGLHTFDDLYLFDTTGSTNNAVLLTNPRIETTFPISDAAIQFAAGPAVLGSPLARVVLTNAPAAGSLALRRFTASVAATINSVTIMPQATSAGANYRGVIYADSAGSPGTLMSSGTQVTGVTSGTAKDLPLTTPQSLSAGSAYWIGFINDTSVVLAQTDGNLSGYRAANTYASGAPGTAPAMTGGQASWLLWGNLTGVSGANYYEVNQQPPPGAYSYIFDATVGHEDLYNMGALSAAPAIVHTVALKGYVQKSDTGAKTVSLRMKSGATDSGGTSTGQAPATTFGWLASYFATNPDTSAAWTGAALNAATAGFKVDS